MEGHTMSEKLIYESASEAEFMARDEVNTPGTLKKGWDIKAQKKAKDAKILYTITIK